MTETTDSMSITDLRQVELLNQRVAELQRLNEEKVRTIAEKDDRIVGLINEIERAQASEGEEVRRCAEARAELDRLRDEAASDVNIARNGIRDSIIQFSDEHDLDREFVNGLLEDYLDMKPIPEYVEATVVIKVTARFKAGSGTPADLSEWYVENNVDFDVTVEPRYSSGLDFEEITHSYVDVRTVETN